MDKLQSKVDEVLRVKTELLDDLVLSVKTKTSYCAIKNMGLSKNRELLFQGVNQRSACFVFRKLGFVVFNRVG